MSAHMHRIAIGCVLALQVEGACSADAIIVSAPIAPATNPSSVASVPIAAFDPARGTLRCIEANVSVTYGVAGSVHMSRLGGPPGMGLATFCVGVSAGIGLFDAVGFVAHASAGSCTDVHGSLPDGVFSHLTPFDIEGSATHTTLITSPATMNHYFGAGNVGGLVCARSVIQDHIGHTPGYGAGVAIDEWTVSAGVILVYHYTPADPCPGDTNGDRVVDFHDLNGVISFYSVTGPCARADVNNDNVVDFLDLNEILSYYGVACAAADAKPSETARGPATPAVSTR